MSVLKDLTAAINAYDSNVTRESGLGTQQRRMSTKSGYSANSSGSGKNTFSTSVSAKISLLKCFSAQSAALRRLSVSESDARHSRRVSKWAQQSTEKRKSKVVAKGSIIDPTVDENIVEVHSYYSEVSQKGGEFAL